MEWKNQMAAELKNMIEAREVDSDIVDAVSNMAQELREGRKNLNDYYRTSTPQKILDVLDEVNQRVKR
jgi:hypothetical protein